MSDSYRVSLRNFGRALTLMGAAAVYIQGPEGRVRLECEGDRCSLRAGEGSFVLEASFATKSAGAVMEQVVEKSGWSQAGTVLGAEMTRIGMAFAHGVGRKEEGELRIEGSRIVLTHEDFVGEVAYVPESRTNLHWALQKSGRFNGVATLEVDGRDLLAELKKTVQVVQGRSVLTDRDSQICCEMLVIDEDGNEYYRDVPANVRIAEVFLRIVGIRGFSMSLVRIPAGWSFLGGGQVLRSVHIITVRAIVKILQGMNRIEAIGRVRFSFGETGYEIQSREEAEVSWSFHVPYSNEEFQNYRLPLQGVSVGDEVVLERAPVVGSCAALIGVDEDGRGVLVIEDRGQQIVMSTEGSAGDHEQAWSYFIEHDQEEVQDCIEKSGQVVSRSLAKRGSAGFREGELEMARLATALDVPGRAGGQVKLGLERLSGFRMRSVMVDGELLARSLSYVGGGEFVLRVPDREGMPIVVRDEGSENGIRRLVIIGTGQ